MFLVIQDTSANADISGATTESSANLDSSAVDVALDSSVADVSSPDKKKTRRKTKAELKAELKEQKVMERKSRRQRVRNRRYVHMKRVT